MKNNKLSPIIITIFNTIICTLLLVFCVPKQIPLLAGLHDKIILISSKWWMLAGIILPIILMVFAIISKNKICNLLFTELIIFIAYDNMLAYSFFCTVASFEIGMVSEVSLSVSIFLPLALSCFIYGAIIKNIPYKNKLGIISKRTTTTEFIWIQSHLYGSYYFRLTGMILFIVAVIFNFLHLPLIELFIFIIGLIIPRIIIEINAKKMSDKYEDIKAKHEHLKNKKQA